MSDMCVTTRALTLKKVNQSVTFDVQVMHDVGEFSLLYARKSAKQIVEVVGYHVPTVYRI